MKNSCVMCTEVISSTKGFMETETTYVVCRRCFFEFRYIINNTQPEAEDFSGLAPWRALVQLRLSR